MTLDQVNNRMEQLMNERLRMQRAFSAANSMMLQLNIPNGDALVLALKQEKAKTNKEAICHWLLEQNQSQLIDGEK